MREMKGGGVMETTIETITIQDLLARAQMLSDAGRLRLAALLRRNHDEPLPEQASIDDAIELFLADACSLARAAEIAGVTRWNLMDRLKERGIPLVAAGDENADEMDALAEELRREGIM
jgi:predicted HTH domain antitoxin